MLDEITATNLGIIRHGAVTLSPGLTVITGETGTGKTLMLGALRLLCGASASKRSIGPAAGTAEVAARLLGPDGDELVVRRTVSPSRSRAYINGGAAAAGELAEVVGARVSIVGQHDHLRLSTAAGVRSLLDGALDAAGAKALASYGAAWKAFQSLVAESQDLGGDPKALERERDTLEHQVTEIEDAELQPDEDDALRAALVRMRNADAIASDVGEALRLLGDEGGGTMVSDALALLTRASRVDEGLADLVEGLQSVVDGLAEVTADVARSALDLEADPASLAEAESRMEVIGMLKRKYGDTLTEVESFRADAADRIRVLADLEERAAVIDAELDAARSELDAASKVLRVARQKAASKLAATAVEHLGALGFTRPVLHFEIEPVDPGPHGAERITLMFASSDSLTPAPIGAGASGGELSRIVLALVLASGKADVDLVAFDEIDAGVGGETALALGRKLKALAGSQQVVCVTHLPQVAAFADTHVVVERDEDTAIVRTLEEGERASELSRMLAGIGASEKGREHAHELLDVAAGMSR